MPDVVPDWKPEKAPKKARGGRTLRRQVHDPTAMRECVLRNRTCLICPKPSATAHHLVPRGGPHFGDDVQANLVALCGSGTSGCHGLVENYDEAACELVGRNLTDDNVAYVLGLLGDIPGREFLHRRYKVEWRP